jgi:ribosomal protein L16 Arg81 hydroxylase
MITTLAELIAPVSLAEFLSSFRARRRLYIPASDSTRMTSLISRQEFEVLLQMDARDNKLIVLRDGMEVPPRLYTTGKSINFNARAFHDLLAQGVSIVVNSIEHLVPQIAQLTAAIERELGIRTNANGYVSFSKGGAFKPHRDEHDVLVVQVHGKKQWRIWNAPSEYFLEKAVP